MFLFKDGLCLIINRFLFDSSKKILLSRVRLLKSSLDCECLQNRKWSATKKGYKRALQERLQQIENFPCWNININLHYIEPALHGKEFDTAAIYVGEDDLLKAKKCKQWWRANCLNWTSTRLKFQPFQILRLQFMELLQITRFLIPLHHAWTRRCPMWVKEVCLFSNKMKIARFRRWKDF